MRGLKSRLFLSLRLYMRRIAHAVRGLKSSCSRQTAYIVPSHCSRGAWIEMITLFMSLYNPVPSHCSRGAWIEILTMAPTAIATTSHCSRGAWIEIDP